MANEQYRYDLYDADRLVKQNISREELMTETGIPSDKISGYVKSGYLYKRRYLIKSRNINATEPVNKTKALSPRDIKFMAEWDKMLELFKPLHMAKRITN